MKFAWLFLVIALFASPQKVSALGMEQIGCYKDEFDRDLPYLARRGDVTPNICYSLCKKLTYPYFGVQGTDECWCGDSYGRYDKVSDKECNMKCKGDGKTLCGGALRNRVYQTGLESSEGGMWLIGCFKDSFDRDLPYLARRGVVTPTICHNLCKELKYTFAGLQVTNECWCGSDYGRQGNASNQECNMKCTGDEKTLCGGIWRNRVYTAYHTANDEGMYQLGCFKDNKDRDLPYLAKKGSIMTPTICYHLCKERKYRYCGVQYSDECWCGNDFGKYERVSKKECNLKCKGYWNTNTYCGGVWRNMIFTTG